MIERTRVLYLKGTKRVFTGDPEYGFAFKGSSVQSLKECEDFVSSHTGEFTISEIPHLRIFGVYEKTWVKLAEGSELSRLQGLAGKLPEGSSFLIVEKHSEAERVILSEVR